MNALTLLKNDHKTVEALFKEFEQAGEKPSKAKRKIVDQIIKELSIHAVIEEQVLYPAARKHVKESEDEVLEALEEHHIVKWTLSELEKMAPTEERFDAKVKVLMESVRHHVKEEEQELFKTLREHMDRKELDALGALLEKAKKTAPTRPHPRAPDTPPGNLVAGVGAAIADRVADAAKRFTSRALTSAKASKGGASRGRASATGGAMKGGAMKGGAMKGGAMKGGAMKGGAVKGGATKGTGANGRMANGRSSNSRNALMLHARRRCS